MERKSFDIDFDLPFLRLYAICIFTVNFFFCGKPPALWFKILDDIRAQPPAPVPYKQKRMHASQFDALVCLKILTLKSCCYGKKIKQRSSTGTLPALARQILSPPRSATKIWPKADTLKFQTDKQDGQTLVFGTIIVPPRKAIRRDKSDFWNFQTTPGMTHTCKWARVTMTAQCNCVFKQR